MNITNIENFLDSLAPMIRPKHRVCTVLFGVRAWVRLVRDQANESLPERAWRGLPYPELIESHTLPEDSVCLIGVGPDGLWTHTVKVFSLHMSRGASIPRD